MKKLNHIPKENPFSVPDGYFEKLSDSIIRGKDIKPKRNNVFIWGVLATGAAAAVIVVFLFFVNNTPAELNNKVTAEIPDQLIENVQEDVILTAMEDTSTHVENVLKTAVISDDSDDDIDEIATQVDYNTLIAEL